jgi:hypothetical protein
VELDVYGGRDRLAYPSYRGKAFTARGRVLGSEHRLRLMCRLFPWEVSSDKRQYKDLRRQVAIKPISG